MRPLVLVLALAGCPGDPVTDGTDPTDATDATDSTDDTDTCDAWEEGEPGAAPGCSPPYLTASGRAEATEPWLLGVTVTRNHTYAVRDGLTLQGDVFVPASAAGTPGAIVVVHGGGWNDCGRRKDSPQVVNYAGVMAALTGAPVFSIEYRLVDEGGRFPANLGDVKCAVARFAAEADTWGFDKGRIAIIGESAGAHLALMAASTEGRADLDPDCGAAPDVALTVAYSPPTDLNALGEAFRPVVDAAAGASCDVPVTDCVGEGRPCDRCADFTPVAHACTVGAPVVLVQAPDPWDKLIPESQARAMAAALEDAGADVTLVIPDPSGFPAEDCPENPGAGQLLPHGFVPCLTSASGDAVTAALAPVVGRR